MVQREFTGAADLRGILNRSLSPEFVCRRVRRTAAPGISQETAATCSKIPAHRCAPAMMKLSIIKPSFGLKKR
jgi:hypothetical protein